METKAILQRKGEQQQQQSPRYQLASSIQFAVIVMRHFQSMKGDKSTIVVSSVSQKEIENGDKPTIVLLNTPQLENDARWEWCTLDAYKLICSSIIPKLSVRSGAASKNNFGGTMTRLHLQHFRKMATQSTL